ncbi:MAG: (2Fe-2S)-binding protein [Deltaproteobacteria bacterium]|nr:(2Fe-2S)-binding protein [Deltaproteobacteria bacterium]
MKRPIHLKINAQELEVVVEAGDLLLDVLREKLFLTGARRGCDTSHCGACTVIMGGKLVHSCLVLALSAVGQEISTIEGLETDGKLHPLQEAFIRYGAFQCGYCTPGMILAGKALLDESPRPTEEEIKRSLDGNLCRCTGYQKIIQAILAVAEGKV